MEKQYLIETARSLIDKDLPLVSNLSNLSALIKDAFTNADWAGFYLFDEKSNKLYLGPFQGEVACLVIPNGWGICGQSILNKKSIIVPDITVAQNYVACSSTTRSEIVVPILKDNACKGVIDLDSDSFNAFDIKDQNLLEELGEIISQLF